MDDQFEISVDVLNEAGYDQALFGVSLNKDQPISRMPPVLKKLAFAGEGHSKFLEQIIVWLSVRAPRYWWQEADTFRLSSKSSQSTMHTILNNKLTEENFECGKVFMHQLGACNILLEQKELVKLKGALPEGFMQRRMWMMSYKTLRNVIIQRRNHRLPHWRFFIKNVLTKAEHPELLPVL